MLGRIRWPRQHPSGDPIPFPLGNKVVVGIDQYEACGLRLVSHIGHVLARYEPARGFERNHDCGSRHTPRAAKSVAVAGCSSYVPTRIAASNREAA
jgi:hypothetical protein